MAKGLKLYRRDMMVAAPCVMQSEEWATKTYWGTTLWRFKTANFEVCLEWRPDDYPDLSWDVDGEARQKIDLGEWQCCDFAVLVYWDETVIGADYLGSSVYADFTDMIRIAINEARKTLGNVPKVRAA